MLEHSRIPIIVAIVVITAALAGGTFIILGNGPSDDGPTVQPVQGLVYDGTMQDLVKVSDTKDTVLFSIDGGAFSQNIPQWKGAGTLSITYRILDHVGDEIDSGTFQVTIAKKAATISAEPVSKTYGQDDPELRVTENGVIAGDFIIYSIDREAGESVGTYTIHVTGESSQGNYEISFADSKFTINRKIVTVTADDLTKSYGSSDPAFSAEVIGIIGDDTIDYSISRETGEDVGAYRIVVSGQNVQGNYEIRFESGVLYIYTQVVTVKANSTSKMFGDSDPALTATVTGGSNIKYSVSRQAGESVGSYIINVTGDRLQGNYLVVFEEGIFSIMTSTSSWSVLPSSTSSSFDGYEHSLITAGTAVGGTAYYRLSTGEYSTFIPTATEPGTYTVYYKIVGDENHADTREGSMTSTIYPYEWNGTETKEPKMIDGKYVINLASELAWIAKNNSSKSGFSGTSFILGHDIDLGMKEWTPIGNASSPFKGIFDGNGCTVKQLQISSGNYAGLFGYTSGGIIKNLTIDVAEIFGAEYVAALSGYLGSSASGIKVSHINVSGNRYVGGIAGYQTSAISESCVEYIGITCDRVNESVPYSISYLGNNAGGIAGMADADIINCRVFHAVVSSYRDVGGIAGNIQENVSSMSIKGCDVSFATIIVDIDGGNAGVISGRLQNNTIIENNSNSNAGIKYTSSASSGSTDSPHEFTGTYDYIIVQSDNTVIYSKNGSPDSSGELRQITLHDVTINAADGIPAIKVESGAEISIVIRGTVTLTGGKNADGINVPEGAHVTIGGSGTLYVTGNNGKEYCNLEGYRTSYTTYDGTGGSGIGNHGDKSFNILTGTIVISNLNALYAYGYGDQAYGIGGDGATVIIENNSTVKEARGGFQQPDFKTDTKYGKTDAEGAPAIGGEYVIIDSSTVELAQGGSKAAAIGAGYWRGTSITINNSKLVDIRGGNASAAIGSSRSPESGTVYVVIYIDNSEVNAVGGHYGAGIGSGYDTYCGTRGLVDLTINITSYSEITAVGGTYGAAIGTGFHSALLKGSIDDTVICHVSEGTKSYYKYSWIAQDIGFGLVDSAKEAKYMVDGGYAQIDFTVGNTNIENPYDPGRMERVMSEYPAPSS